MNPHPLLTTIGESLGPLSIELKEYLGLVRYLSLWTTVSIGVTALVVALWVDLRRRDTIREACSQVSVSPRQKCAIGLVTTVALIVASIVLLRLKILAILGVALLVSVTMFLVLPGIAVAALRLGNGLSRELGRPTDDLRSLLMGLAVLQGSGYLVYLGLAPWLYWVAGGVGGVIGARSRSAVCEEPKQPAPPPPVDPSDRQGTRST